MGTWGGPQGPNVWRGWNGNWETKSREVPGCWKGQELAGAGGSAGHRARAAKRVSSPPPLSCALSWVRTPLGKGCLIPRAAVSLGVAGGPPLAPGVSLTPRARDTPWEGTSFLTQRAGPTPPSQNASPDFPAPRSHQLPRVSRVIHARHAGTALYTTHTARRCLPTSLTHAGPSRRWGGGGFTGEARPLPSPAPQPAATRGGRRASPRARRSPDGAR